MIKILFKHLIKNKKINKNDDMIISKLVCYSIREKVLWYDFSNGFLNKEKLLHQFCDLPVHYPLFFLRIIPSIRVMNNLELELIHRNDSITMMPALDKAKVPRAENYETHKSGHFHPMTCSFSTINNNRKSISI